MVNINEELHCPRCENNLHDRLYNYIDLHNKDSTYDMDCIYCNSSFKLKCSVDIKIEYIIEED